MTKRLSIAVLAISIIAALFVLPNIKVNVDVDVEPGNVAEAAEQQNDPPPNGYWIADSGGGIFSFGLDFYGSLPGKVSAGQIPADTNALAVVATPSGDGYWVLDEHGGVHTFGGARYYGSIPKLQAEGKVGDNVRPMDFAVTPDGNGYWVLDADGGVFAFGNARYFGSIPALRNEGKVGKVDVVDFAPTPSGGGYWIVGRSGGVFTFGDASYHKSIPALKRDGKITGNPEVVGIAPARSGNGYWLVDSWGGVFTFGDTAYKGSLSALKREGKIPNDVRVIGIVPSASGAGYRLLGSKGGVFTFGDARFHGTGHGVSSSPIVSMAVPGYPASVGSAHLSVVRAPKRTYQYHEGLCPQHKWNQCDRNRDLGYTIAAAQYGWTGAQWACLDELWGQKESGWNETADNPYSTARGIAQFLNKTWGLYGFTKTDDPRTQIIAGLVYIKSRYGSPCAALTFWFNASPHHY